MKIKSLSCFNLNCKETQVPYSQSRLFENKTCTNVACGIVEFCHIVDYLAKQLIKQHSSFISILSECFVSRVTDMQKVNKF